eukprot:TRINITY_DN28267_c0_g1_i2.p1 TRINITY_DN28267_c0_g1~~TRINITY_DN28267_c0_g1_i2.p1  ORF type:complete len:833 (+),score=147.44 TRINITY_DN28267_c0_g1_i2:170-2668(+)
MTGEAVQYPCWEFLDCDGQVPQSRSGHTCALFRNRFLYIFGGFDGSNCFDDLYVLDLDTRHWRKIEAGGDRPSGRASHSAVTDELAGVMFIFGGSGSHFGYTNKRDLCEFCFETETWRLLSNPVEDTPSARYGQSMVAYKDGLYVWGGTHGTNYPTDMHRFDLCSKQWEHVLTAGELPCGRYRHQAMVKDDLMYIVGGSGINRYGDVFTFHFGTNVWRKLACTGTDLSDGRYAHSAVLRDGYIYLYGGNDGIRHDDLQQLDLETRIWSRVVVHGQCPPGRDFHAAVLRKDSMVIFGGSNGHRRHNDVFDFHMAPKRPPCTLSADMEALLEQAQDEEALQYSCDVFFAAEGGETSQGVFCHSHLIFARCRRMFELIQEHMPNSFNEHGGEASGSTAGYPGKYAGSDLGCAKDSGDETIDSLFRAVVADEGLGDADVKPAPRRSRCPPPGWGHGWPGGHCTWVPIDLSPTVLMLFLRFLYSEAHRFANLTAEQLYQLFLAAKTFEVSRLAALCERQIKLRLNVETVLPLLKASAKDLPVAAPVQDACKRFFLANYQTCTELRECEALDPKLLCELMRLHNTRGMYSTGPASAAQRTVALPMPPGPGPAPTQSSKPAPPGVEETGSAGRSIEGGYIPPESLAEDLKRLWLDEVGTDFEVVVQDEVIRTHKFMLVARSKYFASCILTSGMVEAQAGRLVIPPNSAMTAEAFRAFLQFIYTGDDLLGVLAPDTAMYLIDASSFYGLSNQRLKHFCEDCVKESFNESHVIQLFEASSRLGVEAVRTLALEFIVTNFRTICHQPTLEQLDKPLLMEILRGIAAKLPPVTQEVTCAMPQA